MCVILHAASRDLIRREEVKTAMDNNPSGFFIAELLPDGRRRSLRTLDRDDVLKFFDKMPRESEVVMHFRVPSRGGVDIANVHGWASNRILFCHNRTLFNLAEPMLDDNWGRTDSEYFFRKVFIPLYTKFGGNGKAYRSGKLHPVVDRIVRGICGDFNKFLFVMPDNTVLHYGEWADTADRPGFYASNDSYLAHRHTGFLSMLAKLVGGFFRK